MKEKVLLTLVNDETELTPKQKEIIQEHTDLIKGTAESFALNEEGQVCVLLEDGYAVITEKNK